VLKIWRQVKKRGRGRREITDPEPALHPGPAETVPGRQVGHWENPAELGHRLRVLSQTFHPGLPVSQVWQGIAGYVAAEGQGIDEKFGPGGMNYGLDIASWLDLVQGRANSAVSERLITAISIAMGGGDYLLSDDPAAVDRMEAIFEFIQAQNGLGARTLLFGGLGPGAPASAYRDATAQVRALTTGQATPI
jgi:hypothetical protein